MKLRAYYIEFSKTKKATIRIVVDGNRIDIPVTASLKAHWTDQFYRKTPTPGFEKRMKTLKSLMVAAYKAGRDSTSS